MRRRVEAGLGRKADAGVLIGAIVMSGCAAGRTFRSGEAASRGGDWDAAVEYYRLAVQRATTTSTSVTGASRTRPSVIRIGTPGTYTQTHLSGTVTATAFVGHGSALTNVRAVYQP